jgi:hypothetical protein
MKTWTSPGFFRIDVPDDWAIVDAGGTVEIEPPTRASACHISTYSRTTPKPPTAADAEAMIRRFPAAQGLSDLVVGVQDLADHIDASASFTQKTGDYPRHWEVRARLSKDLLIVWSYTYSRPDDGEVAQALSIWASLRPDSDSSGRWRRALGLRRRTGPAKASRSGPG